MKRLCTTASILSLRQTPKAVPGSASPQCQPTTHAKDNNLRGLSQFDRGKKVPATVSAIADAVRWAEEIMKAIDERWPAGK